MMLRAIHLPDMSHGGQGALRRRRHGEALGGTGRHWEAQRGLGAGKECGRTTPHGRGSGRPWQRVENKWKPGGGPGEARGRPVQRVEIRGGHVKAPQLSPTLGDESQRWARVTAMDGAIPPSSAKNAPPYGDPSTKRTQPGRAGSQLAHHPE
ncbi:unnamed protein product [Lampetra planeri]